MITRSHKFEEMTEARRPQDPEMNGAGLSIETFEHGGEYPDTMPQALKITDKDGNWCVYTPTSEDGKVVRSHGYELRMTGDEGSKP